MEFIITVVIYISVIAFQFAARRKAAKKAEEPAKPNVQRASVRQNQMRQPGTIRTGRVLRPAPSGGKTAQKTAKPEEPLLAQIWEVIQQEQVLLRQDLPQQNLPQEDPFPEMPPDFLEATSPFYEAEPYSEDEWQETDETSVAGIGLPLQRAEVSGESASAADFVRNGVMRSKSAAAQGMLWSQVLGPPKSRQLMRQSARVRKTL